MKNIKCFLIIFVAVILISCSDNDSTGTVDNNPSEEWTIVIDEGNGEGTMTLELLPDSTITAEGSWIFEYDERYQVTCDFLEGEVIFNGSDFNFETSGTAQHSGNNTSSEFSIEISGMLINGLGAGNYQIKFLNVNWQESLEGNWTAELIDGDGITGN